MYSDILHFWHTAFYILFREAFDIGCTNGLVDIHGINEYKRSEDNVTFMFNSSVHCEFSLVFPVPICLGSNSLFLFP